MTEEILPRFQGLNGQLCIVTSNYYPNSIGGEETFIGQYSRFLKGNQIQFVVVSASPSHRNAELEPVHIRPFSIPIVRFEAYNLIWVCLATLKIIELNSRQRIGFIHSVDTGHAGLAGVFASRLLRCPLIVHSHGRRSDAWRDILRSAGDWRAWMYWALQRFVDGFVARRAAGVIAVSSEVVSFLESLGVSRRRILLAPSAIEREKYAEHDRLSLRKELKIPLESFVIGYLGRLARLKGLDILIDAYARLCVDSDGVNQFLIAGDGPLRADLEALVTARSLVGVRFLGIKSDVNSFLGALDVFVLPSFTEGSPISLLEAMAAGCPIIASDIRGVREIADDSVLLFPPGDSSTLAELLLKLKEDAKMRNNFSEIAREKSREFSTIVIFPRILDFSVDQTRLYMLTVNRLS